MRHIWEHQSRRFEWTSKEQADRYLEKMGNKGWELVSVNTIGPSNSNFDVWIKRKYQPKK